jgi:hypothetical protein
MVLVGCITLARGLVAEGNSSLSESKIENADTKVTAAAMLSQNKELRTQLSLAHKSVKTSISGKSRGEDGNADASDTNG